MKLDENDKIIEATEAELFVFWERTWSDLFDYYSFRKACIEKGVKIIRENENSD